MLGPEIIGVISGIIAILDAAAQVYNTVSDASGLPESFRDVARRLPLVNETLKTVRRRLDSSDLDERFCEAVEPVVEGCKDKAARLEGIFRKVVPQESASRMERYALAVRTVGKGSRVEYLMRGILEDVQLLADNHVMKLATEAELESLREASKEASSIPPPLLTSPRPCSINNLGSGFQNVNTGTGGQINNNGQGQQFIGSSFASPPNAGW